MRIGTIGSGVIVESFVEAGRTVKNVTFTAVYSRSEERAQAFSHALNIPHAFSNLSLFLDSKEFDTVYIASPNNMHFEQAKQALLSGKHVLVEKPIVETKEKLNDLIQIAQDNDLMLFETICNVHMPHFEMVKANLSVLGNIKMVQCNFSQYSSRYDALLRGEEPNVFNPKFSGGALQDINIYNLHFVIGLFGMPDTVDYQANIYDNGIDTSGVVALRYPTFIAECVGAKDSFSRNFGMIQGENGYLYLPGSVSTLSSIEIITNTSDQTVNIQSMPRLAYQIETFEKALSSKDYALRDHWLKHSMNIVEVAKKAREKAGLTF